MSYVIVWNVLGVLGFLAVVKLFWRALVKLRGQSKVVIIGSIGIGFLAGLAGIFLAAFALGELKNILSITDLESTLSLLVGAGFMLLGPLFTGLASELFLPKLCGKGVSLSVALMVPAFFFCYPVFSWWGEVLWARLMG